MALEGSVVLFDGVCNLCTGVVQWIIRHDPQARIRFASLQSPIGAETMRTYGFDPAVLDTFVFVSGGRAYDRSTAALRMVGELGAPWKYARVLLVIPRPLRDFVYRVVAKNRYRWFGQQTECWIPTPALRLRFLD